MAGDEALLKQVVAQNRATRESIQTFYAELRTQTRRHPSDERPMEGNHKYWRDRERVRIDTAFPNGAVSTDWLIGPEGKGFHWAVGSGGRKKASAKKFSRASSQSTGDVWLAMSLEFLLERIGGGHVPIDEILTHARSSPSVRQVKEGGYSLVRIKFEFDDYDHYKRATIPIRLTVCFNRDRNYHVHRFVKEWGASFAGRHEFVVGEYLEFEAGRFFPIRAEATTSARGEVYSLNTDQLQHIKINQPVRKEVFDVVRPPSGTLCLDLNRNVEYPINENWEKIGPEQPHQRYAFPMHATGEGKSYFSQTTEELRRFNWILWISVAVLASALLLAVVRWWRRIRSESK